MNLLLYPDQGSIIKVIVLGTQHLQPTVFSVIYGDFYFKLDTCMHYTCMYVACIQKSDICTVSAHMHLHTIA